MPQGIRIRKRSPFFRATAFIVLVAFSFSPISGYAQDLMWMPAPGTRVAVSPEFTPPTIKGLTIHQDNPLLFDFIIDQGDKPVPQNEKADEYRRLVKYFLASLTLPEKNLWVNLSPYEKDRIIADDFGKTEMGRDLLSQDYILKQITSSIIYPEDQLGKAFWDKVYKKAYEKYGTTDIPVNTFNKVWIVPDEAVVYESGNTAMVLRSHLKVMLEEDYLSLQKNQSNESLGTDKVAQEDVKSTSAVSSEVVREIVLPEIEKEVNQGKNFALLRQIYSSMILATWYKKTLKESLLGKVYADKGKVMGVDQKDTEANQKVYAQYLEAFKKGAYNYIKEDYDNYSQETIPRKYFSGGFSLEKEKIEADGTVSVVGLGEDIMRVETPQNISPASAAMVSQFENDVASGVIQLESATVALAQSSQDATNLERSNSAASAAMTAVTPAEFTAELQNKTSGDVEGFIASYLIGRDVPTRDGQNAMDVLRGDIEQQLKYWVAQNRSIRITGETDGYYKVVPQTTDLIMRVVDLDADNNIKWRPNTFRNLELWFPLSPTGKKRDAAMTVPDLATLGAIMPFPFMFDATTTAKLALGTAGLVSFIAMVNMIRKAASMAQLKGTGSIVQAFGKGSVIDAEVVNEFPRSALEGAWNGDIEVEIATIRQNEIAVIFEDARLGLHLTPKEIARKIFELTYADQMDGLAEHSLEDQTAYANQLANRLQKIADDITFTMGVGKERPPYAKIYDFLQGMVREVPTMYKASEALNMELVRDDSGSVSIRKVKGGELYPILTQKFKMPDFTGATILISEQITRLYDVMGFKVPADTMIGKMYERFIEQQANGEMERLSKEIIRNDKSIVLRDFVEKEIPASRMTAFRLMLAQMYSRMEQESDLLPAAFLSVMLATLFIFLAMDDNQVNPASPGGAVAVQTSNQLTIYINAVNQILSGNDLIDRTEIDQAQKELSDLYARYDSASKRLDGAQERFDAAKRVAQAAGVTLENLADIEKNVADANDQRRVTAAELRKAQQLVNEAYREAIDRQVQVVNQQKYIWNVVIVNINKAIAKQQNLSATVIEQMNKQLDVAREAVAALERKVAIVEESLKGLQALATDQLDINEMILLNWKLKTLAELLSPSEEKQAQDFMPMPTIVYEKNPTAAIVIQNVIIQKTTTTNAAPEVQTVVVEKSPRAAFIFRSIVVTEFTESPVLQNLRQAVADAEANYGKTKAKEVAFRKTQPKGGQVQLELLPNGIIGRNNQAYNDWQDAKKKLADYQKSIGQEKSETIEIKQFRDQAMLSLTPSNFVKFGTSGWRSKLGEDVDGGQFNLENVSRVAQGAGNFMKDKIKRKGILVAYDARKGGEGFARRFVEVLRGNGIKATLGDGIATTPSLTAMTRESLGAEGYDLGIHITASHNDTSWQGIKVARNGVVAPDSFTRQLGTLANNTDGYEGDFIGSDQIEQENVTSKTIDRYKQAFAALPAAVQAYRAQNPDVSITLDAMHGSVSPYVKVFQDMGVDVVRTEPMSNETYPQGNVFNEDGFMRPYRPEPKKVFLKKINPQDPNTAFDDFEQNAKVGSMYMAIDGDADRMAVWVKMADGSIQELNPNDLGLLYGWYMIKEGKTDGRKKIAKTQPTSFQLDALVAWANATTEGGYELVSTPVGSKHFGPAYESNELLLGTEESGHQVIKGFFDDAASQALMILEIMSDPKYNQDVAKTINRATKEIVSVTGNPIDQFVYSRFNAQVSDEVKARITKPLSTNPRDLADAISAAVENKPVQEIRMTAVTPDGDSYTIKLSDWETQNASGQAPKVNGNEGMHVQFQDGSWVMLRLSGTEPIVRLYAQGPEAVRKKIEKGVAKEILGIDAAMTAQSEDDQFETAPVTVGIDDVKDEVVVNMNRFDVLRSLIQRVTQVQSSQDVTRLTRDVNIVLNQYSNPDAQRKEFQAMLEYSLSRLGKMFDGASSDLSSVQASPFGGIDFNSANLNLQIKRDGNGVPLPISSQDFSNINIDGFIPVILEIAPVTNLPLLLGSAANQATPQLSMK